MDFGLKELGITLMVGAFVILGLEAIMHYLFNQPLTGFFQEVLKKSSSLGKTAGKQSKADAGNAEKTEQKEHTAGVVVFLAASFAVGIIAEDLSFKYVDSSHVPVKAIPAMVLPNWVISETGLPTTGDDRVATLIGDISQPRISPLIRDLASNNAFLINDHQGTGQKVQDWIKSPSPCRPGTGGVNCPSREEVEKSMAGLYYYAKNTVYNNPHHYDELRKIQARLEFTRSLSLIAFIFFVAAILSVLGLLIKNGMSPRKPGAREPHLRRLPARALALLAILFGVYFFSLWAYARETDAFNRRAFGYFSTMLITDKRNEEQRLREKLAPSYQPPTPVMTSQTSPTKP